MTRALGLASVATAALVGGSLIVRLANPFGAPDPTPSDLVPHLWGIGALVVLALTRSWAPTLGWSATIVGTMAAALGAVGLSRAVRTVHVGQGEAVLDALLVVALVVPPVIAAAYATDGRRTPRLITAAAWGTVLVLAAVLAGNLVRRTLGADTGGLPEWVWLAAMGALAAIGLVRDLRPALHRTRTRLAGDAVDRAGAHGRSGDDRGEGRAGGPLSALRVFVDELVPGREAGRAEAAESERGRLAADLHADVLPSLRRALAEAEAGGTVERLAADLRTTVDDVESLLAARRSIVLEEIGLLAGVEWLAERVEERSAVRVEIVVADDNVADDATTGGGSRRGPAPGATDEAAAPGAAAPGAAAPGVTQARPPREVERAAFRIAQLALDNVVRHAPGAMTTVSVRVRPGAVRLAIEDDADGPPIDEAAAARSGRRGLADMRAEARACGAELEVGRGADGRGSAVLFTWPRPGAAPVDAGQGG